MYNKTYCVTSVERGKITMLCENGTLQSVSLAEACRLADAGMVQGFFDGLFLPCLRNGDKFFRSYFRHFSGVLHYSKRTGVYPEMTLRKKMPVCSIFADSNSMAVIAGIEAATARLNCMRMGYTGLIFDSVMYHDKVFLHAQTFKAFADSVYFIYNEVFQLADGVRLYKVYETDVRAAEYLERKYCLSVFGEGSRLSLDLPDAALLSDELHLFKLRSTPYGLYIDSRKILA